MKHLKWAVGVFLLAIVPVLAWANIASAQTFRSTVDEGQTVNSSLYSAGKNIDINGTINGDVFCAGQTITIDATVKGDVICAGQDVTVNGTVEGDIRLAGQTVSVGAKVGRSATVAAMSFSLDADAKVGQDLTATGDTLNIKGAVQRDAVASGTSVTFNGPVGRNVKTDATKVRLKSDAAIAGNLAYTSHNKIERDSGAKVAGDTKQIKPSETKNNGGIFNKYSLGFYLFILFGLGLIAIVLALMFPRFMRRTSGQIKASFAKTLIVGVAASFLVPMISIGLALSIIGIPLVFFLLIAWLFGALLSGPIAAYYVGQMVLRRRAHPVAIAALGTLILVTAYYLPIAGVLVMMLAYWLGFGALLLSMQPHVRPADSSDDEPAAKPAKKAAKTAKK
jgi:cytoskeletal protein CcmA (bactofilin family)